MVWGRLGALGPPAPQCIDVGERGVVVVGWRHGARWWLASGAMLQGWLGCVQRMDVVVACDRAGGKPSDGCDRVGGKPSDG